MKVKIKLSNGKPFEQVVNKPVVTIGRSLKCDVCIPEESLSRQHCQIEVIRGEFFVTDLNSANGVYLDGIRIPPSKKIPFATFLQLNIGPLDCQIMDDNEDDDDETNLLEEGRKKTKKLAILEPPPIKVRKKNEYIGLIFSSVFFLSVIGYMAFDMIMKVPESDVVQTDTAPKGGPAQKPKPQEPKVPLKIEAISDSFFTSAEYKAKSAPQTCENRSICRDLKLDPKEKEGVIEDKHEYFIFLSPFKNLTKPEFTKLAKVPDGETLIALHYFFRSSLFFKMLKKQAGQAHLIINNQKHVPYRVLRIHPKHLTGPEMRIELRKDLANAMKKGNSEDFWKAHGEVIKVLDL